jgi:enoyl-CoA hydratase/carnithine racemase
VGVVSEISVEASETGAALIRLTASQRKNALTGDMARQLIAALQEVDADPRIAPS